MKYEIKKAANGKYLVIDTKTAGFSTVAAGMTEEMATAWAVRLNLRAAWGV
jgi:hypothetical protein